LPEACEIGSLEKGSLVVWSVQYLFFGAFGFKVPLGFVTLAMFVEFGDSSLSWWKTTSIFGPEVRTIALSLALVLGFMRGTRDEIQEMEERMLLDFQNAVQHSKKLFLSDKGFNGIACRGARNGDKICFLRGCTKPVVLRGTSGGDALKYRVVGEAFIYLSNADRQKYKGFLDSSWYAVGDDSVTMKEDKKLIPDALKGRARNSKQGLQLGYRELPMDEYLETGLLQDFELI
jgi:hypothetical protein